MSAASEAHWQRFAQLPGAAVDGAVGIASEHAIDGLMQLVRQRRPRRILELGGGIGTLTAAILDTLRDLPGEARHAELVTAENNDYCRAQLTANLASHEGRYRLVKSVEEVRDSAGQSELFDLIVVDGGGDLPNDMGVMDFSGLLAPRGAILVEGARLFQRDRIQEWYGHRPFVYAKSRARHLRLRSEAGLEAKNKPYHLFVFEPQPLEALRLRAGAFANRAGAALRRRLRGVSARGAAP